MSTALHSPRGHDANLHVLGALALELRLDAPVARHALGQDEVGVLAAYMATDLAGFAAQAAALELVTVGAHYDPVELLRPRWPLHDTLSQLAASAPKHASRPSDADNGRIIAFGAHQTQLPSALTPSPDYLGGPLRLVPFVLGGRPEVAATVGDTFERDLLERGMAGAATALAAQQAFGLSVEHARYLTLHDLAAMMAMQYEHAGLSALWPLLETALLEPDGEAWLDAAPEPLVHYAHGEARIALFSAVAWHARYAAGEPCDSDDARRRLARQHEQFEARQRQMAAVLGAHGVGVNFVHCDEPQGLATR